MSFVPALNGDASPFWIALTMTPPALDLPIVTAAKHCRFRWRGYRRGSSCPIREASPGSLVDDVVAVDDGPALVAGQEHGDPVVSENSAEPITPLGNSMATRSGTLARIRLRAAVPASVEETGRHAGRLTGGARRMGVPSRWKTSELLGSRRANVATNR